MEGGSRMPVRKIPRFGAQKNIGKFSSVKTGRVAWFESLLERDYMYLLDYELAISYWIEQPLKIRYGDNRDFNDGHVMTLLVSNRARAHDFSAEPLHVGPNTW